MNREFIKALEQTFQGTNGEYSSKRVAAFISLAVMIVAFVADLFFHLTITQFIFEGFEVLALGALGIAGVERFAKTEKTTTTKQVVKADVNVTDDSA